MSISLNGLPVPRQWWTVREVRAMMRPHHEGKSGQHEVSETWTDRGRGLAALSRQHELGQQQHRGRGPPADGPGLRARCQLHRHRRNVCSAVKRRTLRQERGGHRHLVEGPGEPRPGDPRHESRRTGRSLHIHPRRQAALYQHGISSGPSTPVSGACKPTTSISTSFTGRNGPPPHSGAWDTAIPRPTTRHRWRKPSRPSTVS